MGTKSSMSSNDRENCVILHVNQNVIAKDVTEVGEAIKVHFKGNNANMFNALSHIKDKGQAQGGEVESSKSLLAGMVRV